jgi:acetyl-CoA acetyltransferase
VNVNGVQSLWDTHWNGAKLSVQLFDEMKRRGDKYGIVTMCEQVKVVQEFMN